MNKTKREKCKMNSKQEFESTQLFGKDRNGNELEIHIKGIDQKELAHFGGLDLMVNATKYMIGASANPMVFPEKAGDYNINYKVIALYLNEIGELIRTTSSESEFLENISNIELVSNFMGFLSENKEVVALIDKDNKLLATERE
ncbi:hypothetical protein D7X33_18380 [Butyricicoccus sp. 1XD8-22]|nr:hypothetical protein D7X33_18380 [Butyricicoccus sp. 1XD8-22]